MLRLSAALAVLELSSLVRSTFCLNDYDHDFSVGLKKMIYCMEGGNVAFQITLMILCVVCCGAVGVGLFGNDDLHNAMLQSIKAGNQLAALVNTVKNQVRPFLACK